MNHYRPVAIRFHDRRRQIMLLMVSMMLMLILRPLPSLSETMPRLGMLCSTSSGAASVSRIARSCFQHLPSVESMHSAKSVRLSAIHLPTAMGKHSSISSKNLPFPISTLPSVGANVFTNAPRISSSSHGSHGTFRRFSADPTDAFPEQPEQTLDQAQTSNHIAQTELVTQMEQTYILRFDSHVHKYTKDAGLALAIYTTTTNPTNSNSMNEKVEKLWSGHRFLRNLDAITPNAADYMALFDGLLILQHLMKQSSPSHINDATPKVPVNIEIQSANDIIIKHLNGEYKVSTKSLKPWYDKVKSQLRQIQQLHQVDAANSNHWNGGNNNFKVGKINRADNSFVKNQSKLAVDRSSSDDYYLSLLKEMSSASKQSSSSSLSSPLMGPETPMDIIERSDLKEEMDITNENVNSLDADSSAPESSQPSTPPPSFTPTPTLTPHPKPTPTPSSPSISPTKTYILRFDGGSRGNPGPAGCGMVLYDSQTHSELWSAHHFLGTATNNQAEYMALLLGLQCAQSLGVERIVVQGDSQLVLRQVEGRYRVKNEGLRGYYEEVRRVKGGFERFETSHIERERNGRADGLANEAMDGRSSVGFRFEDEVDE